jgi:hypothetical protein
MDKNIKYFVISLPRSGTSSLRVMFENIGLKVLHAPGNTFFRSIDWDIDFYCDTPIYTEDCIHNILEWSESKNFIPKFIYINRSAKSVWNSWNQSGLYKNYLEMYESREKGGQLNGPQSFDLESYDSAFGNEKWTNQNSEEVVLRHKEKVCNLVNHSGKSLLIFDFEKGYDQLCEFLGVDLPENSEVPHINKSKKDSFIH